MLEFLVPSISKEDLVIYLNYSTEELKRSEMESFIIRTNLHPFLCSIELLTYTDNDVKSKFSKNLESLTKNMKIE